MKPQHPFDCIFFDMNKSFCEKIRHKIENGFSIQNHCSNCSKYK